MKKYLFSLVCISSLFFACEYFELMSYKEWLDSVNDDIDSDSVNGYNDIIYLAGYFDNGSNNQACYWTVYDDNNIARDELSALPGTGSYANSIQVEVKNIYTCGHYNETKACYWINNKRYELENSTLTPSIALSIYVVEEDVYVAGYYTAVDTYKHACYWKNGEIFDLPGGVYPSEGRSIYVVKNDVYVSGGYLAMDFNFYPCYWKNGLLLQLPSDGSGTSIFSNSIFVKNGTIYNAGWDGSMPYIPEYSDDCFMTGYWIDNSYHTFPQSLEMVDKLEPSSIYVSNNGIYIAGKNSSTNNVACFWKNGVLEYYIANSRAESVFVFDDNFYICGAANIGGAYKACYWKNSPTLVSIEGYTSEARDVYVTRRMHQ